MSTEAPPPAAPEEEPAAAPEQAPAAPLGVVGWGRYAIAALLAVASGILILAGALAQWASTTLVSTSGFVSAVGPLSAHPDVTKALSATVSDRAVATLKEVTASNPLLSAVIGAVGDGLQTQIQSAITSILSSETASKVWTIAITSLHDQTISALRGESSAITLGKDTATIDLNSVRGPIMEQVPGPDQLKTILTNVDLGTVTVQTGSSSWVLQTAVRLSDNWEVLLALGALAAAGAAVVAPRTVVGLQLAGAASVITSWAANSSASDSLDGQGAPSALSQAIQTAVGGGIETSLHENLTLVTTSGVVLVAIRVVARFAGSALGKREPSPEGGS